MCRAHAARAPCDRRHTVLALHMCGNTTAEPTPPPAPEIAEIRAMPAGASVTMLTDDRQFGILRSVHGEFKQRSTIKDYAVLALTCVPGDWVWAAMSADHYVWLCACDTRAMPLSLSRCGIQPSAPHSRVEPHPTPTTCDALTLRWCTTPPPPPPRVMLSP